MPKNSNTRQKLINSAQKLIYSRSYANVGVQEICNGAGVKKGSFYHFFTSKSDMTLEMLDHFWVLLEHNIFNLLNNPSHSPLQQFDQFFNLLYKFQLNTKQQNGVMLGCPFGNLASELSTQDEQIRIKIDSLFKKIETQFSNLLEAAINKNELSADTDVQKSASAIFAYVEGIILVAKTRNQPELIQQLSKSALPIIKQTLN